LANQPRGTERPRPEQREDEDALTQAVTELASRGAAATLHLPRTVSVPLADFGLKPGKFGFSFFD
jgi:hypothetical protein